MSETTTKAVEMMLGRGTPETSFLYYEARPMKMLLTLEIILGTVAKWIIILNPGKVPPGIEIYLAIIRKELENLIAFDENKTVEMDMESLRCVLDVVGTTVVMEGLMENVIKDIEYMRRYKDV